MLALYLINLGLLTSNFEADNLQPAMEIISQSKAEEIQKTTEHAESAIDQILRNTSLVRQAAQEKIILAQNLPPNSPQRRVLERSARDLIKLAYNVEGEVNHARERRQFTREEFLSDNSD